MGVLPVFVEVKAVILPLPDPARPMAVLLLVQVKVAPGVLLVKTNGPAFSPKQNAEVAGTDKLGTGLTITILDTVVVPHSFVTDKLMP